MSDNDEKTYIILYFTLYIIYSYYIIYTIVDIMYIIFWIYSPSSGNLPKTQQSQKHFSNKDTINLLQHPSSHNIKLIFYFFDKLNLSQLI